MGFRVGEGGGWRGRGGGGGAAWFVVVVVVMGWSGGWLRHCTFVMVIIDE